MKPLLCAAALDAARFAQTFQTLWQKIMTAAAAARGFVEIGMNNWTFFCCCGCTIFESLPLSKVKRSPRRRNGDFLKGAILPRCFFFAKLFFASSSPLDTQWDALSEIWCRSEVCWRRNAVHFNGWVVVFFVLHRLRH